MKVLCFILVMLTSTAFSQGIDYFPVHVGNTGEWHDYYENKDYSVVITRVDTLSDNSFDIYHNDSDKPRYRIAEDGNVYQHLSDSLIIWYDFSVAHGDTFETEFYKAQFYVIVSDGWENVFGERVQVKHFRWEHKLYDETHEHKLSQKHGTFEVRSDIGPVYAVMRGSTIGGKGYGTLVSIEEEYAPRAVILNQNYPNPFNPGTVISFQLPADSEVRLDVFDILGRLIATPVYGRMSSGYHTVNFDASGLHAGIYFYRLTAGEFTETRKMTLVK